MTAKKVTAVLLATVTLLTAIPFGTIISNAAAVTTFEALDFDYDRSNVYTAYLEKHKGADRPDDVISVNAGAFTNATPGVVSLGEVAEVGEDVQSVTYKVNVASAGLYNIRYDIKSHEKIRNDAEFGIEINGESPYNEAMTIRSAREFKNVDGEITIIRDEMGNQSAEFLRDRGNDIRPSQEIVYEWKTEWVEDSAGLIDEPLSFYLNEGVNEITFKTVGEPFYLKNILVCQFSAPKSYAEVKAEYDAKGYKVVDSQLKVQGETANLFSKSSLYPTSVRNNSQMEPYHTSKTRINATGGSNWGMARSYIEWDINVPESGLYRMAIKFRQSEYVGMFATRGLMIDGEYPYDEMRYLRFNYDSAWQMLEPAKEDGEPYYVYLEKGDHTLRMVVSLGEMAESVDRLTTAVYRLNTTYSQVVMLASTTPDTYRDYYYDRNIPTLIDDLKWARTELSEVKEDIIKITGTASSQTATLETFIDQLDVLIEDPDKFNTGLETFKNNISSLSQWIIDNKTQPVTIDYICLGGLNMKLDGAEAGFFKSLWEGTKTFFSSFVEDYDVIAAVDGEGRKVKVWINTGRDQINILNNMINDEFTPNSGVNVQLELVQGNMIEATLAGKGPDVALMIGESIPVNYAIRGALVDLSQFEGNEELGSRGFDDVFSRYADYSFESFVFQMNEDKDEEAANTTGIWECICGEETSGEACHNCGYKKYFSYYALPETQNFNMMFYRKDILAQLGLGAPETWDDFFALLPVLRRNNLEVGMLSSTMFQILLYQNGGAYYNEERTASGFSTKAAEDAFVKVTDCFTKYDFPLSFNFYTRFRSGEMPISIQPYNQFNLINAAAPEIQGLWDMVKIPGTIMEDGSINYTQNVSAAGTIMFEKTKDKEAAWAFMEWYTRNDMQSRYGEELESVMGSAGRYAAANQEAFRSLSWTREQSRLLAEQMEYLVGVPEVPGSYFTYRTITLAFNDSYVEMENPYKALSERTEDLDEEIARKYDEFGLYRGENDPTLAK